MKKLALLIAIASICFGCGQNAPKNQEADMNNPVIETIMARRSIRHYTDQPVARELLQKSRAGDAAGGGAFSNGSRRAGFGSAGTGTYQQNCVTAVETITYPLVLLLNKINGVEFKDQPEDAERVSCDQFIMNSDEDMAAFQKSIYFTANASDALFTPEEVLNMTAYANPDATYEQLKKSISTLTVDSLK